MKSRSNHLSENQPSSHLQFYLVNELFGMLHKAQIFSNIMLECLTNTSVNFWNIKLKVSSIT